MLKKVSLVFLVIAVIFASSINALAYRVSSSDYDVTLFNATGNGTTDDSTAIQNAINAAQTAGSGQVYFPRGTYRIAANVTSNTSVALIFEKGAVLIPDSGVTVTINGEIDAGLYQIFTSESGKGTITCNLQMKYIYPEWWGANSTDGNDDAEAVRKAINSPVSGGTVFFTGGTYICNSGITLKNNVNLEGSGFNRTVLDFSSASTPISNWACLYGSGTLTQLPGLSSDVAENSTAISLASSPNVSEGDIIAIYDATDYSYSTSNPIYRKGEFSRVRSVSANTITVDAPLFDSYVNSANLSIYKLNPITLSITNLQLKSVAQANAATGIIVDLAKNCTFQNLLLSGSDFSQLTLARSYECDIENVNCNEYASAIGYNYGITISCSQRINVNDCRLYTTRHGLAIGGADYDAAGIVNREVMVSDCIIGSIGHGGANGADVHGNAEYISYRNCELLNGVKFGGDHVEIRDCKIWTDDLGFAFYGGGNSGPNHTIIDNLIEVTADVASYEPDFAVINIQADGSIKSDGVFRITGNEINFNGHFGNPVKIRNTTDGTTWMDVEISDNIVYGYGATENDNKVLLLAEEGCGYRNVTVADNELQNTSLYLNGASGLNTIIRGNTVLDAPEQGICILKNASPLYSSEFINVFDNTIVKPGYCGIEMHGNSNATSIIRCVENTSINCNQELYNTSFDNESSIYIDNAKTAVLQNNTIGDSQLMPTQNALYAVRSTGRLYERDNQNIGSVTQVNYNFIENVYGGFVNQGNSKVSYSSAIPAAGTYNVGDIVWSTVPVSGGNAGWICTTAGTQGTLGSISAFTTSGTPTITVNSSAGLTNGSYITISGVSGVKKIIKINGTTVTLDSNCSSSGSSRAVSYSNAVFNTFGAIDSGSAPPPTTATLAFWHGDTRSGNDLAGYWFKQVLIDGVVVWEKDIASSDESSNTWYQESVDITNDIDGKSSFNLEFRLICKQGAGNYSVRLYLDDISINGLTISNPGFETTNSGWIYSESRTEFDGSYYSSVYHDGAQSYLLQYPSNTSSVVDNNCKISQTITN